MTDKSSGHGQWDCEDNQDLAMHNSATSNDKIPDPNTNQRTDIQLDSVHTEPSSTDIGMERTSESEPLVVMKSESVDKPNIEIVQQNRTTSTSDSLNVVEGSCVELGNLSLESNKESSNIHLDTLNSDIEKVSQKEVLEGNVTSNKPAAASSSKKKKWRKRQYFRRIARKEYRKKQDEENFPPIQGFVGRFAAEVTEMIFLLLSPKDLASSSLVCKSWRDAINTNIIWRRHCKERGWTSPLSDWSCFQKSSHLWSGVFYNQYRDEKLLPLCEQRLCFNKYMFLLKNWKERNFSTYRLQKPNDHSYMSSSSSAPVPSSCDGKYLVMFDNNFKNLMVWGLEGEPYRVNCDSCQQRMAVTDIRVCFDTIAIVQGPYISVYINKGIRFEHAYIKSQFVPDNNRLQDGVLVELSKINIEMNKDYLVGCPNFNNANAYVWDRITGDPITSITFDSNYPKLSVINLYESSIYFGRQSLGGNAHKVVEYDLKQKGWSKFNIDCPQNVKQLVVNNDYICTVTSENGRRELINDVCVWNRTTGAIIKSFQGFGKSYQFVNNYIIYYYNARVLVHPLDENDTPREVCLDDCITNVRPVFDHLLVLSTMGKVEVWDWMMKKKLYTVFYSKCINMEMWVDCEKIVLLSDRITDIVVIRF